MKSQATISRIRTREPRESGPKLIHSASNGSDLGASRRQLVVIVDDQTTGRIILSEIIRSIDSKPEVVSFSRPEEALEFVRHNEPDLILTDYRMPSMNGIEFTRRVRKILGCGDVPLIVITVVDDLNVRYEALEAGATDFLIRPLDQHECKTRCRNLLTLRHQQNVIKNRANWLEKQVQMATSQILSRERETLLILAKAGEHRDQETGNHVLRMAKYSRLIAEYLGLSRLECEEIEYAAPLHDIGKIGVSDNILLKPGRLTAAEWELMKTHTTMGHAILKDSNSRFIKVGAVIALNHHEKFNGSGYPHGLEGEVIPLEARIVAIADVYDALRTPRPYKPGWSREDAVAYITTQAGKHFDPSCVEAFMAQQEKIFAYEEQLSSDGLRI